MKRSLPIITAVFAVAALSAATAFSQTPPNPSVEPAAPGAVRTGIEVFLNHPPSVVVGKRVGLITNPTGVDRAFRSDVDLLAARADMHLVALFGPEHGVRGEAATWLANSRDAKTKLPVYSLYGKTLSPTAAMLKGVDVLVFDLQDTGARFYTYISTLALAMKAAAEQGIPFVVLDRPNPLGGTMVAGPVLDLRWKSFMGMYPLPIVHGMTIGELARLFNQEYGINANLTIVPVQGWRRSMWFDETGLPWVITSPGIPHFQTALLYPAMGPLGDTNLSVGTLTAKPFEFVGQTFVEPWRVREALESRHIGGVAFREAYWRGEPWRDVGGPTYAGVEVRIVARAAYRPVDLTLQILDVIRRFYPRGFSWGHSYGGTYVFDWDMGTDRVRREIIAGKTPEDIEKTWEPDLQRFLTIRAKYLLYE